MVLFFLQQEVLPFKRLVHLKEMTCNSIQDCSLEFQNKKTVFPLTTCAGTGLSKPGCTLRSVGRGEGWPLR